MRFSNMVDYKGDAHFVCKTGRKNIRILKPGDEYEKSFVVPLKKVSNRRPADIVQDEGDDDDLVIDENVELSGETADSEDEQFLPQ